MTKEIRRIPVKKKYSISLSTVICENIVAIVVLLRAKEQYTYTKLNITQWQIWQIVTIPYSLDTVPFGNLFLCSLLFETYSVLNTINH